jgi:hypothetical protein
MGEDKSVEVAERHMRSVLDAGADCSPGKVEHCGEPQAASGRYSGGVCVFK